MIRDPGEDSYQEIKDFLIQLSSLSNYKKFEALINLPFTSDTKPTVHMSSMLNLYLKKFKLDLLALDLDKNPDALARKAN